LSPRTVHDFYGARLRAIRHEDGRSLSEVGRAVGVAGGTIDHYESGYTNPSRDVFHALCRFLDVAPEELLLPDAPVPPAAVPDPEPGPDAIYAGPAAAPARRRRAS
jgi:transcriptional regulator with XRE-family HTH domain